MGGKMIVLVWVNSSYHISSKAKEFILKMRSRELNCQQD